MATLQQIRKELTDLQRLAEMQVSGSKTGVIVYDTLLGRPDTSILPDGSFYILLPAKDGDPDRGNWEGPYLDPGSPEPSGAGGPTILNLRIEDCGEGA